MGFYGFQHFKSIFRNDFLQLSITLHLTFKPHPCVCSHRSRDEDRISKPLPLPAKMVEETHKALEQAGTREEKQLPPLPGQSSDKYPSPLVTSILVEIYTVM